MSDVARRTVLASAWAVPVVVATAAAPALAASLTDIPVQTTSAPAGSAQSYFWARVTNPGATAMDVTISVPITEQFSQSFVYPPWSRVVTPEYVMFSTSVAPGETTTYGDFAVIFLRPTDPPADSITVPISVSALGYNTTNEPAVVTFS